jgi:hypothetical protein
MRFEDLTSIALRGVPSRNLLLQRRKRHIRNVHPTHFRSTNSEEIACPQWEDFGSPLATHTDSYLVCPTQGHGASTRYKRRRHKGLSWHFRILSTTSRFRIRYATLLPVSRTPGFASPGTFPSRCFSHPQGFAPPNPFTALFHAATVHRISSTSLEEMQDKSGALRQWLLPPHLRRAERTTRLATYPRLACTLRGEPHKAWSRQKREQNTHTNVAKARRQRPSPEDETIALATDPPQSNHKSMSLLRRTAPHGRNRLE